VTYKKLKPNRRAFEAESRVLGFYREASVWFWGRGGEAVLLDRGVFAFGVFFAVIAEF
jgi:hypothetical protein